MRQIALIPLLLLITAGVNAQLLPGFSRTELFGEQQMLLENMYPDTRILINAPSEGFGEGDKVLLVFFALPNGNSIEQTLGKKVREGDDWHYNIQHIGAQTRFLRTVIHDKTIVVVYLEAKQKSWPAWKAQNADYEQQVKRMVDEIKEKFASWDPQVVLNGHSGGGRFLFSYIEAEESIPDFVVRIAFLDSDYGYEDTIHGPKLVSWLKEDDNRRLCTLAYNDSVVVYNGKQLVSPTGGTWYRSRMMLRYLSEYFSFRKEDCDSLMWFRSDDERIEFVLKNNPEAKIFHTQQVEYNGFIHSMLCGTALEQSGYGYFGPRVYGEFISDTVIMPIRSLNIPPRRDDAETGSAFMKRVDTMPLQKREEEIFRALAEGNVPSFLRNMKTLSGTFADTTGKMHTVSIDVMPDYLSIGSDDDFCRIPMNPHTAQKVASLYGASLLTAKLSDFIYERAEVKLTPFNYIPVGNANELVSKFTDHNTQIESQLARAGGMHGQLVAGIKKDVILSSCLADKPNKVVIYGWHKPDGRPIQPAYSGHVDWYVDYSHGIRLINNQVIVDSRKTLLSDILAGPVLYTIFSDEERPMEQPRYVTP